MVRKYINDSSCASYYCKTINDDPEVRKYIGVKNVAK